MKLHPRYIHDAAARLKRASRNHDFVIGDAPGGISEDLRQIYRLATHATILCSKDKQTEIDKWKVFFSTMNLQIVATIITRISGMEQMRGGLT